MMIFAVHLTRFGQVVPVHVMLVARPSGTPNKGSSQTVDERMDAVVRRSWQWGVMVADNRMRTGAQLKLSDQLVVGLHRYC